MEAPVLLQEENQFRRWYYFSTWWITHRVVLRQLGLGAIALIDGIFFVVAAWGFVDAYAVSFDAEQIALVQMVNVAQSDLHAYTRARSAKPLQTSVARVFSI